MDLTIQERQIIADFRSLPHSSQNQVAELILKLKSRASDEADLEPATSNQCHINQKEIRPEIATEPIFTE